MTPAERHEYVTRFYPYVQSLAGYMAKRHAGRVDKEDLVSLGAIGLMQAAERFDPSRGIKFYTFAKKRVAGAMSDGIRGLDTLSRDMRRHATTLAKARRDLARTLGRMPDSGELAQHLDVDTEKLARLRMNAAAGASVVGFTEAGPGCVDNVRDSAPTPDDQAELRQAAERIAERIAQLPDKQRLALLAHHVEGMRLRDVGARMGLTESRACQLVHAALGTLRAELTDLAPT